MAGYIYPNFPELKKSFTQTLDNIINDNPPPPPEENSRTARGCLVLFLSSATACTLFRRRIVPRLLSCFEATRNLTSDKQYQFGSYALSFVHAVGLSAFGTYKLLRADGLLCPGWGYRELASLSLGYFVEDFLSSRREWTKKLEFAIHHVLAVGCAGSTLYQTAFNRFAHLWSAIEWSTIFLDLMWFAHELRGEKSRAFRVMAYLFAANFAFWRMIFMPGAWFLVHIYHRKRAAALGSASIFYNLTLLLQAWWFVAILRNLRKKLT